MRNRIIELFCESVEIKKPSGKVSSKRITKNRGMINQQELLQYQFKTENGNDVKVQFNEKGEGVDVVFYVNDTLDDGSSGSRDPEILNGVLWLMRVVPDRMKWNVMTFSAWSGKGDTKVIRDLPIDDIKNRFEEVLGRFRDYIEKYEVTEIPASASRIELSRKLGRELRKLYDINKEDVLGVISDIYGYIKDGSSLIHDGMNKLVEFGYNNPKIRSISGYDELIKLGRGYEEAIRSHSDEGYSKVSNRRQSLYKKIMDRYFSDIWDVEQRNSNFTMKRKGVSSNLEEVSMYHGSSKKFDKPNLDKIYWVTPDEAFAKEYAQGSVVHRGGEPIVYSHDIEVKHPAKVKKDYIRITHLLNDWLIDRPTKDVDMKKLNGIKDAIVEEWHRIGLDNSETATHNHWNISSSDGNKLLIYFLETLGYDSIYYNEMGNETYGIWKGV